MKHNMKELPNDEFKPFNGEDSTEYLGLVRPLVVTTDKEFVAKLKKTFGF